MNGNRFSGGGSKPRSPANKKRDNIWLEISGSAEKTYYIHEATGRSAYAMPAGAKKVKAPPWKIQKEGYSEPKLIEGVRVTLHSPSAFLSL